MESFLFRARRSTQIAVFVLIVFSQIGLAPAQTVSAAPEPKAQPPAPLAYHALPSVGLSVPSQVLLGNDVNFTVTFDNTGTDATDIGYGPFIDLIIPVPGADGVYPGTPAANAYDGLGLTTISASYLGVPFVTSGASQNMWVLTFNGSGNATHPLLRDSSGNYVTVTGTPGAKLVVLKLPFGSFTPDQPAATVDISVDMSNLADVGTPLTIQARGGYQFGYTPLDDFCCGDTPPVTSFVSKDVTPSIWTLSKTYAGPENEAASGPNFRTFYPEQYTVTATIAPGQSVTALTLTDTVPDNLQFYSLISTSPGGASCSTPSTSSPGGTLICTFAGSVSGSASMTFDFYIPLNDASAAAVIDPTTGTTVAPPTPISVTSCNNASASASWTPIDTRDTALPLSEDPAGCEHTLSDKSLAVQKSSTIVGGGSLAPKKVVEYTLNFQVSDFFALDNVQLTDVLSDGQRLDTSFTPTLAVSGNGYSFAAVGMDPANYDINCYYTTAKVTTTGVTPGTECETNPGSNSGNSDQYGTTQIVFKISDELVTQGQSSVLFGGCVDPSSAATPLNCDPSSGGYNDGPTYGTITFRAIVQEKFSDNFPSGDDSVDQGDVLTNIGKYVQGDVQDLTDRPVTGTGSTTTDDSSVTLNIATGTMSKSIYAINGITDSGSWPTDSNGKVKVTPGDTVTYRIQYDLPIGDEENLEFTDYLPLPVFSVDDPQQTGGSGWTWTFDPTVDAAAPASGSAKFGPADTFYNYSGQSTSTPSTPMVPVLTDDVTNNMLDFYYGDFNDTRHQAVHVDLLFTITVSSEPFADGLYLTNEAHGFEGSTNGGVVSTNALNQIVLTEPVIVSKKGVIWTSNPNATFSSSSGSITFLAPGNTPRWSGGNITASYLASRPINANVSGVDAGDTVSFAITIQNTGSSLNGAFDITILDTMPAEFQYPGGNAANLNLQIYYGDGSGSITYTKPDDSPAVATDIFGSGIKLVDPVGKGICQVHDPNLNNDVIIITYDLQIKPSVTAGDYINTEVVNHYASKEGGPNYVPTPGPGESYPPSVTDTATTSVNAVPSKYLMDTSASHTGGNEVAIGEVVTYRIVTRIPEGTSPNFQVRDLLPSGLTFLNDGSARVGFVSNGGIASTGVGIVPAIDNSCNLTGSTADNTTPAAPLPCALDDANIGSNNSTATNTDSYVTGTDPYFKLGDLVNSDSDDDAEYVVIDFNVVVDNNSINATSQNDNGETRDNRARGYINGSQSGSDSSAVQVKIVEPVVKITKTVDDLFPAPGQIVHFTLTLAHDMAVSKADAFDVSVSDILPSSLDLDASSIVITPSGGASGVTNTSNDLTNTVSATIDTFPLGAGLTITFDATVVSAYGTTIDNTASITWTSLPGTDANERTGDGSGANDYTDSSSVSLSETRNLAKNLIAKSLNNIGTSYVTIGEVLTYQLILTIPANSTDTYIVTDTLDSGLAFLDCSDIVADADITSSVINFTAPGNCNHGTGPGSNPLIENSGGKVTFNFGTVTNANAGSAETITITYRVVVLDTTANQSGVALSNEATGTWSTSSTTKNAPAQSIIQPTLEIEKTVDKTVVQPGSTVTFTLHVHHAAGSETDAYDLVLTDTLDPELINPTNFTLVSGAPWTNLTIGPSDIIFQWDSLPLGAEAVVQFDATISFNPVQRQFHNNASLEWTSLPGDFSAPQSTYNDFSTERRYDPTRPADVYAANAQVLLTIPRQPRTGFAPNEITSIPPQPDDKTYQDLGDFWLEIPRLGVKIPIVGIPLSDDGEWDLTWLADQAGYLDGTAYPTHTGNSVITAHVYMPDGQPGPFVNLSTLQWGDQIIIHLGGQRYIYEVRSEKVISPENTSVFKHQDYPWLTLITCKDYDATTNTYTKRVAVQAVLVKVEP